MKLAHYDWKKNSFAYAGVAPYVIKGGKFNAVDKDTPLATLEALCEGAEILKVEIYYERQK